MIDIVKLTAIHLDKIHIRTNPVDTTLFPFTKVKLSYIKNVFLPKVKGVIQLSHCMYYKMPLKE